MVRPSPATLRALLVILLELPVKDEEERHHAAMWLAAHMRTSEVDVRWNSVTKRFEAGEG